MEIEFEQSKSLDWLVHQEIQAGLETKKRQK